jgi:hypothetical protein
MLKWHFKEKSVVVCVRECSKEKRDVMIESSLTASFEGNAADTLAQSQWMQYDNFFKERGAQHKPIKEILDEILSVHQKVYGEPSWTVEKKCDPEPAPTAAG